MPHLLQLLRKHQLVPNQSSSMRSQMMIANMKSSRMMFENSGRQLKLARRIKEREEEEENNEHETVKVVATCFSTSALLNNSLPSHE